MVVETAKNQITLNRIVGQKKENRIVESDIIVNDVKPDVLNVISTNGIISVYKKEAMEGKVRLDGTINTYIIYLADDEHGSVRSLNTTLDFTQIIDVEGAKENMQIDENIIIKSFDIKIINGRKLSVKANLETSIGVYANEAFDLITEINSVKDIKLLNRNQEISELVGQGNSKVTIRDTIAIDIADDFAEIMKVNFVIKNPETKVSYNKVLSKADAEVEIIYLTEDNRICRVSTQIPIMGFVDIQDINENCKCELKNRLCNLIIKPNTGEEHSIYIEAEIEVSCRAYQTKEINIIEDLYSMNEDLECSKKDIDVVTCRNNIKDICIVKENLRMPELTGNVFDVQITTNINNMQARTGKIVYEGNLTLEILLEENNGINLKIVDLPFNFEMTADEIDDKSIINTETSIIQNDFIIRDGTIEMTVGIEFKVFEHKNKRLSIIEEIETKEAKDCNNYSMVIYFVKPGDTLWKIAKMFKSTIEDIAEVNKIENVDKINVGQQLYIPRFCTKKVSVV